MTDGNTEVMGQASPEASSPEYPKESEGLGPLGGRGIIIGVCEGVNDSSSALAPQFAPTRYELAVLLRHYFQELNEIRYLWELHQQVGSEWRMELFAGARLNSLWDALGDEGSEKAIATLREEWNEKWEELERDMVRCENCGGGFFPCDCPDDDPNKMKCPCGSIASLGGVGQVVVSRRI